MQARLEAKWNDPSTKEILTLSMEEGLELSQGYPGALIDVRTVPEYLVGHIPGAINIPSDEIEHKLNEFPKDKPIFLYCRSGMRSGRSAKLLLANGFRLVINIGGILQYEGELEK